MRPCGQAILGLINVTRMTMALTIRPNTLTSVIGQDINGHGARPFQTKRYAVLRATDIQSPDRKIGLRTVKSGFVLGAAQSLLL